MTTLPLPREARTALGLAFALRTSAAWLFFVVALGALPSALFAEDAAQTKVDSAAATAATELDAETRDFLANKVQPLLAARCYECHGPDADEPSGGLRLDSRAAVLAGGETGPAIVPGDPHQSLLIEAVEYRGAYEMPPDSKMPAGEVAILARWIELGAPWIGEEPAAAAIAREPFPLAERLESHWVWQPVKPVAPPKVSANDFTRSPIDRFVLAALEEKELSPAPPAERRTLLRRAWFDLVGLPPPEEAIEAFASDPRPTAAAFADVVDELLASPHFGERWARHWLDLVRFAETLGHEYDYPIAHAFQYRDYVIRALNADVPYDQFVTEHLAGDLLNPPRRHPTENYNESIIATGFWYFFEGQHAPVDARADELRIFDNQIDVFGKTFLGMTVACARCHDHKFDAISTVDYYGLVGFLKSSRRQEALLDPHGRIADGRQRLAEEFEGAEAALHRQLAAERVVDAAGFARQLRNAAASDQDDAERNNEIAGRWRAALADEALAQPSHPLYAWRRLSAVSDGEFDEAKQAVLAELVALGQRAEELDRQQPLIEDFDEGQLDGWFASGFALDTTPVASGTWNRAAERPTTLPSGIVHSGQLGDRLAGVLRSPTFIIEDRQLLYRVAGRGGKIRLIIDGYTLDEHNPLLFKGAMFEVDTGGRFRWHRQAQDVSNYVGHRAHIEIIDDGKGFVAVDEIRFTDGTVPPPQRDNPLARQLLADRRVDSPSALAAGYGRLWRSAHARWLAGEADTHEDELVRWALDHGLLVEEGSSLTSELSAARERMNKLDRDMPKPLRVLATTEGTPEDEFVLIRGNHRTPADPAPRRLLSALDGVDSPPVRGSGRLDLAARVVDPGNPLTARVIVNRLWHHLFGRGIVASVDNFGVLGQAPSHPELLDHLAAELVADDWSLKRAIRRIMLSSTYQMSSKPHDARAEEIDPTNELLHRQRVRRLQGEVIRDAMLQIAGRLDPQMYGRSVPIHLTPFMDGRGRPDKSGPLDGKGRRSIYIEVRRNFLSPMMIAFDTPIPFGSVGRRNVSNVPAQPLILLNDPFVLQQAKRWAQSTAAASSGAVAVAATPEAAAAERIRRLFVASFARTPTADETEAALAFLRQQAAERGGDAAAWQDDLQAWTDLCHVIWNVKEFVFIN
ncbi:MAG: DUF1553 domain-containing protein [Planctomycetota bacterium]|nr:MAG: DUF1553 domain-containing protein [Planctomycetota bacterium]REK37429.1 MAG: DUF1553 domain-containing protein [Planctomycetota bacterium]